MKWYHIVTLFQSHGLIPLYTYRARRGLLIIYRVFVVALWALVKNGGTFVDRSQLHRVEILLGVAALRARLFYNNVLVSIVFIAIVIIIY